MKHGKRQLAAIFAALALPLGGCSAHTPTSGSTAQPTESVPTSAVQEEQTVITNENSILTLQHAEEIGLGSRSYRLADINA